MAMMHQPQLPLRNSGARTSDWIGRVKGRVIYAFDLSTLASESVEAVSNTSRKLEAYDPGISREEGLTTLRQVARAKKQ